MIKNKYNIKPPTVSLEKYKVVSFFVHHITFSTNECRDCLKALYKWLSWFSCQPLLDCDRVRE